MSNGYEKAVSLGLNTAIVPGSDPLRGYTDEEIVGILHTLTVSNIACDAVRPWLREQLLWFRTGPTTMGGTIQAVLESPQTPMETKQELGLFWSAVFGDGAQNLLTTVPTWAGLVWQIIQGLTQAAPDAAALVDSFYALDGGRPYRDLTVEQFAAQRTAAQAEAALTAQRNDLRSRFDTIWNQIGTSEQSDAINDLRAIATELEAA